MQRWWMELNDQHTEDKHACVCNQVKKSHEQLFTTYHQKLQKPWEIRWDCNVKEGDLLTVSFSFSFFKRVSHKQQKVMLITTKYRISSSLKAREATVTSGWKSFLSFLEKITSRQCFWKGLWKGFLKRNVKPPGGRWNMPLLYGTEWWSMALLQSHRANTFCVKLPKNTEKHQLLPFKTLQDRNLHKCL